MTRCYQAAERVRASRSRWGSTKHKTSKLCLSISKTYVLPSSSSILSNLLPPLLPSSPLQLHPPRLQLPPTPLKRSSILTAWLAQDPLTTSVGFWGRSVGAVVAVTVAGSSSFRNRIGTPALFPSWCLGLRPRSSPQNQTQETAISAPSVPGMRVLVLESAQNSLALTR